MRKSPTEPAEWLVNKILTSHSHSGKWANELCALIQEGTDPNVLRPLLDSSEQDAVRAATFIMSEAASHTRVFLSYSLPLSRHASKRVRANVVDFIAQQGRSLPVDVRQAVELLVNDADPEVSAYARQQFQRAGIGYA